MLERGVAAEDPREILGEELDDAFRRALAAVQDDDRVAARNEIMALRHLVCARLDASGDEARALALANAHAVEMLDDRQEREVDLQARNADLDRRVSEAEARARDLDAHVGALADATVEGMFMLDEHDEQLTATQQRAHDLEVLARELELRATVDELTGLYNHRYLKDRLKSELERAHRYSRTLSILFIDIDHFKQLNDQNGHATGDAALKIVSALLRDDIRGPDILARIDGAPFVARYGGEELIGILPETDLKGARVVAERIRVKIREADIPGREKQPTGRVTISVGIAQLEEGETMADLLRRADEGVYRAKRNGRDRVEA